MTSTALTEAVVRSTCRRLDPARHPLLRRRSRDEIYDGGNGMAPGGLLLADLLASELALGPGDRVLDLGCGRGQSSIYLATRHQVQVVAVDLWIHSEDRRVPSIAAGVDELITHLQGDVARGLPIAPGSLDAIFCLQSFHCFGTRPWLLRYLASLLKPGGRLGIAQGCFREEVTVFPPLFRESDGWNVEYHNYHSVSWWRNHFESSGVLDVTLAREVTDGDIMWEDDVLYRGDLCGWSPDYLKGSGWLIRHILAGRSAPPSLTHCMVVATR